MKRRYILVGILLVLTIAIGYNILLRQNTWKPVSKPSDINVQSILSEQTKNKEIVNQLNKTQIQDLTKKKLVLGVLSEGLDWEAGCGCTVGRFFVDSAIGKYEHAVIKLNDITVPLREVSSNKSWVGAPVGSKFSEVYEAVVAPQIQVRFDLEVTSTCKPGDDGCEATSFSVQTTVSNSTGYEVKETSSGWCGC